MIAFGERVKMSVVHIYALCLSLMLIHEAYFKQFHILKLLHSPILGNVDIISFYILIIFSGSIGSPTSEQLILDLLWLESVLKLFTPSLCWVSFLIGSALYFLIVQAYTTCSCLYDFYHSSIEFYPLTNSIYALFSITSLFSQVTMQWDFKLLNTLLSVV